MDEGKVYRAALTLWGADAQTLMAFEEMAELQKELCKHARGKDNRDAIAEEIADVEIMLAQMKILHGCVGLSAGYKEKKLERLAARCGFDVGSEPEHVTLGPGVSFRLEKTSVSGPYSPPQALEGLREVYVNATPEKAAELERMMQEAGPGMIVNLGQPFDLEDAIRKTVAETFKAWTATAKDGGCIVIQEDEAAAIEQAAQEAGPEAKE